MAMATAAPTTITATITPTMMVVAGRPLPWLAVVDVDAVDFVDVLGLEAAVVVLVVDGVVLLEVVVEVVVVRVVVEEVVDDVADDV